MPWGLILGAAWKLALLAVPAAIEHYRRSSGKSREAAILLDLVERAWQGVEGWRLSRSPAEPALTAPQMEDAALNHINAWRKTRRQAPLAGAELEAARQLLKLRSQADHYARHLANGAAPYPPK